MIQLTYARANVAGRVCRPGATFLVCPEDILFVDEEAIYDENGSYDGTRRGSRLVIRNHMDAARPVVVYSTERPGEIAALIREHP